MCLMLAKPMSKLRIMLGMNPQALVCGLAILWGMLTAPHPVLSLKMLLEDWIARRRVA